MRLQLGVLLAVLATDARAESVPAGTVALASVEATIAPAQDDDALRALTDDPVLGKADRVDGNEARGMVAFTFDDGPNPETTPAVIDALQKYNVPATFFVVTRRLTGKHGKRGREILARMVDAGFEIGSHSVSHVNLRTSSAKVIQTEIDSSIRTLAPQTKRAVALFRPPFGAFGKHGKKRLLDLGLTDVRWSVDTLDWQAKDAAQLRKRTVQMIVKQNGGVVLMHDVKPITAKVIAGILDDLEAENCQRLAAQKEPIVPVSIHYFLKDGKTARPVPPKVRQRTEAYLAALPTRCANRPLAAPPETSLAGAAAATPAPASAAPPARAPAPVTPPVTPPVTTPARATAADAAAAPAE